MNRAMYAAAMGMAAEQGRLEAISANLANADVPAFKSEMPVLASLREHGNVVGVTEIGRTPIFTQGKLEQSGGPFDIALHGEGFFVVQHGQEVAYTRSGSFARNAQGLLENTTGWHLAGLRLPADAAHLRVEKDGRVYGVVRAPHEECFGRIPVAVFANPEQLEHIDATLFQTNAAAGRAERKVPGAETGSAVYFGMLEHSNVSIVEAMMEILTAQRAYEADAKGIQAADDMQRIANNLERG